MNRMKSFLMVLSLGLGALLVSACDDGGSGGCGGCTIEGQCVARDAADPDDPCRVCAPGVSKTAYSPRPDGATCDDGVACSVADTCQAGVCLGRSDCDGGLFCDPDLKTCVLNCPHCSIDGWCYYANQKNPRNPCQRCDMTVDRFAWSDNDGAACDDGVFCNGADSCLGGACTRHDEAPCVDDGVECNGEERCDEANRSCTHANDFCAPDEVCDEATDRCCLPMRSSTCGADGNLVWEDSCGNRGAVYRECPFGCQGDLCVCSEGFSGDACDRCVIHVHGAAGSDASDGTTWGRAKATLQAGIDAASARGCEVWVAAGSHTPAGGRMGTFSVPPNLVLYGGFAGTELSPRLRNLAANPTILEGEIGDPALIDDNVCTLMVIGGNHVVLDGFTIQHGHRATDCPHYAGGIHYQGWDYTDTLVLRNLILRANNSSNWTANWEAAALYFEGASILMDDCRIEDNTGGAMLFYGTGLHVKKTIFRNNESGLRSTLHIYSAEQVRIENSQFLSNRSTYTTPVQERAAALHVDSANPSQRVFISGSVFADNTGYCVGAISSYGPLVLTSSTIAGNRATIPDHGLANLRGCTGGVLIPGVGMHLIMRNSVVWGNSVATPGFSGYRGQFGNRYPEVRYPLVSHSAVEYGARACLPVNQVSDGQMDCPMGDDEYARGIPAIACAPGEFQCLPRGQSTNPQCILVSQVCDGVTQCANGRDEADCTACGAGSFSCLSPGDSWNANLHVNPRLVNWDSGLGPLDLRLMPGSPCVDAGVSAYLFQDVLDLDDDGDTTEPVPVDLAGNPRVSGAGLDLGAHERQ